MDASAPLPALQEPPALREPGLLLLLLLLLRRRRRRRGGWRRRRRRRRLWWWLRYVQVAAVLVIRLVVAKIWRLTGPCLGLRSVRLQLERLWRLWRCLDKRTARLSLEMRETLALRRSRARARTHFVKAATRRGAP